MELHTKGNKKLRIQGEYFFIQPCLFEMEVSHIHIK
jgi:hypothetical protein